MKLKLFITMCLTFFGITTMVARTEQVKKGPLIYEINTETKKAAVTGFNTIDPWAPPLDTVIILPEIEGYPVTSIKQYAFYNCLSLRDLTIPGSVTYIAKEVFNGCEKLNTVTFQPGPAKLTFPTNAPSSIGLNECPIIQINLGRDLDKSPFRGHEKISKLIMLDGLNCLPVSAFSDCKSLKTVEFASTMDGINSGAFRNCTSLKSISIPPSIERILDNAFEGCTALSEFIIEDDTNPINLGYSGRYTQAESPLISCPITRFHMGRNIELDFYDDYIGLLHSGPDLTLSIGKDVSKIKSGLFSDCEGLHEIEIPDNVTEIGAYAFSGCENLKYVKMSNSVETYEYNLFSGCYKLQKIEMSQNLKTLKAGCFLYCMALEEISIPASVTEIDVNSSFSTCSGLRSLRFEDSTTPISIGDLILSACPLEEIYIGRDVSYSPDTYNRRNSPFSELESLKKVTLGDAVSKIPAHMFERNPFTEFHIPNSIKSIGYRAFSGCPNLTTIVFPNSLSIIEYGAFYGCIYNHRTTKTNQKYPSVNL